MIIASLLSSLPSTDHETKKTNPSPPTTMLRPPPHLLLLLSSLPLLSSSSSPPPPPSSPPLISHQLQEDQVSFRPSVAIVIGIFSIMFSLTFLLLMYAKFCYSPPHHHHHPILDSSALLDPRSSGLDRSLIASLPFFRFSALKGPTSGLDCAVCLSTFLPHDLLRLLPKCKHAFHVHCVDTWLLNHSTCPLCRAKIDPHDATSFFLSASSRALFRDPTSEPELDLYLERESSSRFSFVGTSRSDPRAGKTHKGTALEERLHRIKHRVVVSDVVFKNHWSDLSSSDLISLRSEMLGHASSMRFPPSAAAVDTRPFAGDGALTIREEMERKRAVNRKATEMEISTRPTSGSAFSSQPISSILAPGEKRCVSEITNLPRFHGEELEGERARRLWLPIVRRTVQWLHGREKRSTPEV